MKKFFWLTLLFLLFILSGGLVGYAYWLYQVEKGDEALRGGDADRAIEIYQETEALFARVPWLAYLLRDDYQKLTFNQVRVFYLRGQSDEAIEKLEEGSLRAPFLAETGEYFFWAGNILVRKALQTQDRAESLDLLKEALEIYQKGLVLRPGDWDLKYNYELVKYLLSLRVKDEKKGEEKAKSILEKRPGDPFQERLAPEKRG